MQGQMKSHQHREPYKRINISVICSGCLKINGSRQRVLLKNGKREDGSIFKDRFFVSGGFRLTFFLKLKY